MKHRYATAAVMLCSVLWAGIALGDITPEEATQLKTTLTPLGAERAGNKEGTIPAWDGGYTKAPAGYKSGDPRPDPFADDKPIVVITADNLAQYQDKLAEGFKELFKKYPKTFKIIVYPTHRTAAAPQWVYDNIAKNAIRAKTTNAGLTLEGAYGGIPFPIPHNGFEAMWNHVTAWTGFSTERSATSWVKPTGTPPVLAGGGVLYDLAPYYDPAGSPATFKGVYNFRTITTDAPAYQAGTAVLYRTPLDQFNHPQEAWQYFPGQRRVRKVPNLAYDTPNFFASGVQNFDEFDVFFGPMDRYNMKLVGKKEMYIPYNANQWWQVDEERKLSEGHPNPEFLRFELHRVWIVEATLAPGKRNVLSKRRFYLDEDTWQAVIGDSWDSSGSYWRLDAALPMVIWDLPGVITFTTLTMDLHTGIYCNVSDIYGEKRQYPILSKPMPETAFSPDTLAGEGVR